MSARRPARAVLTMGEERRETVLAALEGRPCPPGCDRWQWFLVTHARRDYGPWAEVRAVFAGLPRSERRAIIRGRRCARLAGDSLRLFDEEHAMRCIPRHDRLYGKTLVAAPMRSLEWDPRELLRDPAYLEWDGTRPPRGAVRTRKRPRAHTNGNGRC